MGYEAPAPRYVGPARHHGAATNKPIDRIVIHATVSACATGAVGIANYFKRTDRYASAHYVVDAWRTIQALYDSWVAYHAPPNENSLGIELCCSLSNEGRGHWQKRGHQRMLRRAARLTAGLCLAYGVPVRRLTPAEARRGERGIMGHNDVRDAWGQTTHWDPGPYFPWHDFLRMVREEQAKIRKKGGAHKPDRKPTVSLDRVQGLARRARWSRGYGPKQREDVAVIEAALKAEGVSTYAGWQRKAGFDEKGADGVPGEVSLKALGRKHGFRVVS